MLTIANSEDDELQISATKDHVQSILTPTAIICVPIALLAAALLALVLIFRVDPQPNLFTSPPSDPRGRGYILVNFSASRLPTSHLMQYDANILTSWQRVWSLWRAFYPQLHLCLAHT